MDLLILTTPGQLSQQQLKKMQPVLGEMGQRLGMNVQLFGGDVTARVERDLQPLVDALTAQTEMMGRLVLALADSGAEDEPEAPRTYMDGTPL